MTRVRFPLDGGATIGKTRGSISPPDVGVETCWLGTCTDRLGVITGVRGIGVLGEHLLLANRDGAVLDVFFVPLSAEFFFN